MNIKNHRNTHNSLPSLMLCWSLWVDCDCTSFPAADREHGWSTQHEQANRPHRTLLAEFTSSLSGVKTDVQNTTIPFVWLFISLQFCCTEDVDTSSHAMICQLMSWDNSNGITFKQGHPSPKKQEGGRARKGCVGCTAPMRTHSCSMLPLAVPVVMMLAQAGAALHRDRNCLC